MDKTELIEFILKLLVFDGTYPPLFIGAAVFFVVQCLCLINKKRFVRLLPVFCIALLLVIAFVWGIYAEINHHAWSSFAMVFGLMAIKISAFAIGDALAWIVHKIWQKKKVQKEQLTEK